MATIGSLVADLKLQSAAFMRDMSRAQRHMSTETSRMRKSLREVETSVTGVERAVAQFRGALVALGGALALRHIVQVAVQFQDLQASLRTVTGSAAAGAAAFEEIKAFASTTPFSLQQATEAFIKLKALGLDPSMAALRSYGNTAAAMGKSLSQFIEAVADASTGEFERLKEFGITAKQQGDVVRLTFQGVTTQIGKNATEIQAYLRAIGDVQFATAMEERMKTLGGAISNMTDALTIFLNQVAEGGFGRAVADFSLQIAAAASGSENLARDLGAVLGAAVDIAAFAFSVLADNANLAAGALAGFAVAKAVTMAGTLAVAVWEAVRAFRMLGVVVAANPLGAIATVIGVAVAALVAFKDETITVGNQTVTVGAYMAGVWKMITTAVIGASEVLVNYGRLLKNLVTLDFEGVAAAATDLVASARSILDAPAAGFDEMRRRMAAVAAESTGAGGALNNAGAAADNAGAAAAKASKDFDKLAAATRKVRDFLDEERFTQTDAGKAAQPYIDQALALQEVMRETAKATKGTEAYAAAQRALLDVRAARAVAEEKAVAALKREGDLHVAGVLALRQEADAALKGTTALNDLREMRQRHADVMAFERQLQDLVRRGYDLQGRSVQDLTEEYRKWRDELDRNTKLLAEQEKNRELLLEPFKNAVRGIQDAFAGLFRSIFDGGVNSFRDLRTKILDIMKETAAQVAALLVFRPVVGNVLGGLGLGGIAQQMGLGSLGGGGGAGAGAGPGTSGALGDLFGLGRLVSSAVSSGFSSVTTAINAFGASAFGMTGAVIPAGTAAAAGVAPVAGGLTNAAISPAAGLFGGTTLTSVLGGVGLGFGAGTLLNSLLGGSQMGGMIGSGGGALAGALIGSIVPGIGTILGGLLGGALGGGIGGLFGGKVKDPQAIVTTKPIGTDPSNFAAGIYADTPFGRVGMGDAGTRKFPGERSFVDFIATMDKAVARYLTDAQTTLAGELLQTQAGSLRHKFQTFNLGEEGFLHMRERLGAISDSVFGSGVADKLFKGLAPIDEDDSGRNIEEMVARFQQASAFLNNFETILKEMTDGVADFGAAARQSGVDQLRALTDALKGFDDMVDTLGLSSGEVEAAKRSWVEVQLGIKEAAEPASELEQGIERIKGFFSAAGELAKQVGLSEAQVQQGLQNSLARLAEGWDKGLADRILGITDPAQLALRQHEEAVAAMLRDVETLGGTIEQRQARIVEVERWAALERQKIVEQFAAQTTGRLRDWLNRQALGSLSSLSPDRRMTEARRQFDEAIAARDYEKITGAADALLTVARQFYASSAQYAAIERHVRGQVEGLLGVVDAAAGVDGQAMMADAAAGLARSGSPAATVSGEADRETVDALRRVADQLAEQTKLLRASTLIDAEHAERAEEQRDEAIRTLKRVTGVL